MKNELIKIFCCQYSVACLHPTLLVNDSMTEALVECMLSDYPTAPRGFYCAYDMNEWTEDMEKEDRCFPVLGLGDFFYFNLLLLFVIPVNSPIITRGCIALICIVLVLFGDLCTTLMRRYGAPDVLPAIPFPAVLITIYAIILDAIGQYLDTDCEGLSRMKDNFLYSF